MTLIKTQLRYDLKELTEEETAFLNTLKIENHNSWTDIFVSYKEYIKYYKLFREIIYVRETLI